MTIGTVGDALKISASGLTIVFLTLVALGIFVTIISKVVGSIDKSAKKDTKEATQPSKTVVEDKQDGALIAAIIGAVSAETKLSVDKFTITSIEEKK